MSIIQVFGDNVKLHRSRLHLSQESFAELCGLHRTYISDIERYNRNVSLSVVEKIASVVGVRPFELLIPIKEEIEGR